MTQRRSGLATDDRVDEQSMGGLKAAHRCRRARPVATVATHREATARQPALNRPHRARIGGCPQLQVPAARQRTRRRRPEAAAAYLRGSGGPGPGRADRRSQRNTGRRLVTNLATRIATRPRITRLALRNTTRTRRRGDCRPSTDEQQRHSDPSQHPEA